MILSFLMCLVSGTSAAEEVKLKGRISGVLCASEGRLCPSDPEHAKKAELLGIFTEGKKFYYLADVPYRLLELNFLKKKVEVEGKVLAEYSSLIVSSMKVGGRLVFKDGYLVDPMGHKILPGDAVWAGGEFYCPKCAEAKGLVKEVVIPVEGMTCPGCEANVERAVRKLRGVIYVKADHRKGEVRMKFEKGSVKLEDMIEAIRRAGYKASRP